MSKSSLEEVAEYVVKNQVATAPTIQRHLRMAFAKVMRLLNELEELGVVGPTAGSFERDILAAATSLPTVLQLVRQHETGAVSTDA